MKEAVAGVQARIVVRHVVDDLPGAILITRFSSTGAPSLAVGGLIGLKSGPRFGAPIPSLSQRSAVKAHFHNHPPKVAETFRSTPNRHDEGEAAWAEAESGQAPTMRRAGWTNNVMAHAKAGDDAGRRQRFRKNATTGAPRRSA